MTCFSHSRLTPMTKPHRLIDRTNAMSFSPLLHDPDIIDSTSPSIYISIQRMHVAITAKVLQTHFFFIRTQQQQQQQQHIDCFFLFLVCIYHSLSVCFVFCFFFPFGKYTYLVGVITFSIRVTERKKIHHTYSIYYSLFCYILFFALFLRIKYTWS